MSDTADRVKKIVVEHLNVDAEKVTDTASFIEDLGADSLDTVELVMALAPDFPASNAAQVSSTPQASGVTRPSPVTTTRRIRVFRRWLCRCI